MRRAVAGVGRGAASLRSRRTASGSARCADCSDEELAELTGLFDRELYPVLTPLAVGPGQPFPYISGLSLSLVMFVRDPETGEERFARVKVPETLPRYVPVGDRGLLLPVEEVIGPLPARGSSRAWRSRSRPSSVSRATPTSRSPTRPTTSSRRSSSRCAAAASARSCASRSPRRSRRPCSRACRRAWTPVPTRSTRSRASSIWPISWRSRRSTGRSSATSRGCRSRSRGSPPENGGRDLLAEIRRGDVLIQLPYDSFLTSVEAFVRNAVKDPT